MTLHRTHPLVQQALSGSDHETGAGQFWAASWACASPVALPSQEVGGPSPHRGRKRAVGSPHVPAWSTVSVAGGKAAGPSQYQKVKGRQARDHLDGSPPGRKHPAPSVQGPGRCSRLPPRRNRGCLSPTARAHQPSCPRPAHRPLWPRWVASQPREEGVGAGRRIPEVLGAAQWQF